MQLVTNAAMLDRSTVASALLKATNALLSTRNEEGVWTGELSSSALSTATALTALALFDKHSDSPNHRNAELICQGLKWLAANANDDGGGGDTTQSISNLSTTIPCWAAFGAVPGAGEQFASTVEAATNWLNRNSRGTPPRRMGGARAQ